MDIVSILFLLLGAVAGVAAIYYSFGIAREWVRQGNRATKGTIRRRVVPDSSLDAHIATQWSEGRLRLDSVLVLIKQLGASLEREVETLRRLDHSDPLYEREARQMVEPTCGASSSINISEMSAARWSPFCSSVPKILRNLRV
jgi:hypothetical protein